MRALLIQIYPGNLSIKQIRKFKLSFESNEAISLTSMTDFNNVNTIAFHKCILPPQGENPPFGTVSQCIDGPLQHI